MDQTGIKDSDVMILNSLTEAPMVNPDGMLREFCNHLCKFQTAVLHLSRHRFQTAVYKVFTKMSHITFAAVTTLSCLELKSSLYGIDTIKFIGQELWQTLPIEIKESQSLEIFKRNIKSIKTFYCSCKLCNSFVSKIGFL